MNTTTQSSAAVTLLQAGLAMPLETVVLSRSQRKALDYAKSLHDKGQLDSLSLSGNKTDKMLADAMRQREAVTEALNNNQKMYSLILLNNGSDTRFELPKSAKIADLFAWVAALEAQIRGKADSTAKAVETRRNTIMARFGDCINLVEALRVVQVAAPAATAVTAPTATATTATVTAPAATTTTATVTTS